MANGLGHMAEGNKAEIILWPVTDLAVSHKPYALCLFSFHDSFNFDAELKETLNESPSFRVPFAASRSDISHYFKRLRENRLGSTPWHIGCKPFRRFEQISL
jgi:hypothetical protein